MNESLLPQIFASLENLFYLCTRFENGEVLEWLKRHAWKACIRQKRIRGSNPRLSAELTGQKWSVNE